MIPRKLRVLYYGLTGPVMWLNGKVYKALRAPRKQRDGQPLRLHLGPGQENYLPQWINIDANRVTAKRDIWADLRNPLPFYDNSVDAVYSHHVIEHLPDMERHFRDVFRVLKSGGVYRCGGPNGDTAVRKLIEEDHDWFYDWPDKYESIGGRFVNFVFCRNEHLTMLTESFLRELARRAGFDKADKCLPVRETHYPDLFSDCLDKEWETTFDAPHTLILEFRKP